MSDMEVSVKLTKDEIKFLRSFCILRPMNRAVELLENVSNAEGTIQDLDDAGPIYENIRHKLVEAINIKQKEDRPAIMGGKLDVL